MALRMIRHLTLSLLLSASLAHAGPVRLCVVGDSIPEGFGPATRGWSSYLVQDYVGTDFSAKNVSQSGDKVAAARAVFEIELAGAGMRGCTWVAFHIGTNDLPDGTSAATIYAAIDSMMDQAESAGANTLGVAILVRGAGPAYTADLETRRKQVNAMLAARTASTLGRRYAYVDASTAVEGTCSPTGFAPAWAGSTAYSLGDVRVANSRAYVVTTAGTSAGSGGPTGTGQAITDNTVTWDYAPCMGDDAQSGGTAPDGLHPSNAGQRLIANAVKAAVSAVGGW